MKTLLIPPMVVASVFGIWWAAETVPNPTLPTLTVKDGGGYHVELAKVGLGNNVTAILLDTQREERPAGYGEFRCNFYNGQGIIVGNQYENWLGSEFGKRRAVDVVSTPPIGVRFIECKAWAE